MNLEVYFGSDDVAALYQDGKRVIVEDTGEVISKLCSLCGVEVVYSDDFMLGQFMLGGAAKTTAEIEEYRRDREARQRKRAELRRQIAELEQQERALR